VVVSATTPAEKRWRPIVAELEASGLTAKAFAAKRDLNYNTLAWWRSKICRSTRIIKTQSFVQVELDDPRPLVIRFRDRPVEIEFSADIDPSTLRALIDALC
jgi:lambda repressor-like predicted transcriptional regulator